MVLTISIVIPAHEASSSLKPCLEHVAKLDPPALECLVVDDASEDGTASVAASYGVRVLHTGKRRGPGFARNLGAQAARGDILLFLDADVLAPPDTIARVLKWFSKNPALDALFGSYDDQPGAENICSQYRNLLHCYTHRTGDGAAFTFWTGCGAVRRSVLLDHGGFVDTYGKPWMEDVELGYRLRRQGREIRLDPQLRVKHLKHWGFWSMVRTDLFDRAVPWTLLILKYRRMPDYLNLQWTQRLSVLLVFCSAALAAGSLWGMSALGLLVVAALNMPFYKFLAMRKGSLFAIGAFPLHCVHYLCSGSGFALGLLAYLFPRFR